MLVSATILSQIGHRKAYLTKVVQIALGVSSFHHFPGLFRVLGCDLRQVKHTVRLALGGFMA